MNNKERYTQRKEYFKTKNKERTAKGIWRTDKYRQTQRIRKANPQTALLVIEKLLSVMNPDEKNKDLNLLYRIAHSANRNYDCYKVHEDWRKETIKLAKELRYI